MVLDAQPLEDMMEALIVSDGRAGHENQSLAFCKLLDIKHELLHVKILHKRLKIFAYIFDWLNIYTKIIFSSPLPKKLNYDFIISCGSSTYYPSKYFSKKLNSKSIALMSPKCFKNNFYHIFAISHDSPKITKNMTILPVNISLLIPTNIYVPKKESIGIIIGGSNGTFLMNKNEIKDVLEKIKKQFFDYEIAITSSPRTAKEIEELIEEFCFDYEIIYSKNKINPIADFLFKCKYVFITQDSTSMISDAVCNGNANIEIIKLKTTTKNSKFERFTKNLQDLNLVHIYDGNLGDKSKKIDLKKVLEKASL